MKYFLAFATDSIENCMNNAGRIIIIPNKSIHPGLDVNNNLKALCSFTTEFSDEDDLKAALTKLIPEFSVYMNYRLVIAWNRKINGEDSIRANAIPYKSESAYFDFEELTKLIASQVFDPFFSRFCSHYMDHEYLRRELNILVDAVNKRKSSYDIEMAVRGFLNKALYGRAGLEFAKLYKMVVLISNILNNNPGSLDNSSIKKDSTAKKEYSRDSYLTESQLFEQEWLEDRASLRELGLW